MASVTEDLFEFIEKSPSCFHAVENIKNDLVSSGFEQLYEGKKWTLVVGKKYFVVRNNSSIISFVLPETKDFNGFLISASHSDSPCFKVKENPEIESAGCIRLNVEKYGGMLIAPWFDRPLSLAGRVVLSEEKNGILTFSQKLIHFNRNLMMIPNLAIHMNRDVNEGHKYDVQSELIPVITTDKNFKLKKLIADELGVSENIISGFDLFLYNRDKPVLWGNKNEFISSPRIDDLECVFTTLQGFKSATSKKNVLIHCVFDNEEVGSQSRQGADSTFLKDVLERINDGLGKSIEEYRASVARSFLVSADNAHAVHPNYCSFADPVNRPVVNGGPVIKFNASQKYTSDSLSGAVFKKICEKAKVPYQIFTNNSNIAGGSTLGNISTSQVSILSVDIGLAQWAMHSPNESAGALDPELMVKAIRCFYESELEFPL